MNTINRRRTQLSVVAVAALAIFAVAAVMLLAGGAPAQATTAALTPDDGAAQPRPRQTDKTPTPPRHNPPEPCPGETGNPKSEAASLVQSGHIALFDVYWNPVEKELTNTSCPPTVKHVPAQDAVPPGGPGNPGREATPAKDVRSPSDIDIAKTVIHIPNSARIDLNAAGTPYTSTKYPELWKADAKEDRDTNGDGTPDGVGDGFVWALPACPPDGMAAADDLCIIFSAALLNSADWKEGTKIEYLLDHVHQTDIDKQDPRYTLAYDVPAPDATGPFDARWDSSDAQVAKMPVAPGEYERPMLFFTDRGTYEFQVHIRGNPDIQADDPVSPDKSVTSDMREYVIHVGAEADLGVTATATPDNPSPSDTVTVTIAASNDGPEAVPATSVGVTLPPGLTYASHAPAGDTFADRDGVRTWNAGSLESGASKSLAITATVDAETHGQQLAVEAAISGTETVTITETVNKVKTIRQYPVPVLDPEPSNDTDTDTITVAGRPNTDPMFFVLRSVDERSAPGTKVGDPVKAADPDSGDTLKYSLTGTGADQFTTSSVAEGAQIEVADGANLDYEVKPVYDLVLTVSDGKDADGNDDNYKVDHTIGVRINLGDVADRFEATIKVSNTSPNVGEAVTFTVALQNPPAPWHQLGYIFQEWQGGRETERDGGSGAFRPHDRSKSAAGTYTYDVGYWQWINGNDKTNHIVSNRVTVTWSAP